MPTFYNNEINLKMSHNLPAHMSVKNWAPCSDKLNQVSVDDIVLKHYGRRAGSLNVDWQSRISCLFHERIVSIGYQVWLHFKKNPISLPLKMINLLKKGHVVAFDGTILNFQTRNYLSDLDTEFIQYAVIPAIFDNNNGEIIFGYLLKNGEEDKFCVRNIESVFDFRQIIEHKIFSTGKKFILDSNTD